MCILIMSSSDNFTITSTNNAILYGRNTEFDFLALIAEPFTINYEGLALYL